MKDPILAIMFLVYTALCIVIGAYAIHKDLTDRAIENNVGYYHPQTSDFTFKKLKNNK